MRTKLPLLIILFIVLSSTAFSHQNFTQKTDYEIAFGSRPEIYFAFTVENKASINQLSRIISIDRVDGMQVKAYANRDEFKRFLEYGLKYDVLPAPSSLVEAKMFEINETKGTLAWDAYPTYPAYESMMTQYQTDYPDLCQIQTIGTLGSGRKLLAAKISANVDSVMNKPQFLWVSSIHGDELTGYVLMLRLIDYLLQNYGVKPEITNLLNKAEIYINPLMNPDGAYHGGNNSVNQATRNNANSIDLNRNFPDPQAGQHPDGYAWQPETVMMMDYANSHHFVMGGNFHGGAEVVNYPWDTWQMLHADDDWWQFVSREYADTVHLYGPSGYMTDLDNGITNGYAWYQITGGRQDYMNYFLRCREATFEISVPKLVAASTLPGFWNSSYRSFINYMEEVTFGVQGIVTDSLTGSPLAARVFITSHDHDSSHVWSALPLGNYCRLLYAGNYNMTFSASGYYPKTVNGVSVTNLQTTDLDVQLAPITNGIAENESKDSLGLSVFPNPATSMVMLRSERATREMLLVEVYNNLSALIFQQKIKGDALLNGHPLILDNYAKGLLMIRVSGENQNETLRLLHQ